MVYEDESSNGLSSLDISSSSDGMMYRIPVSIDDKDYMGIENSALDVCLDHGLPPERRIAFEGFETRRRFLVCAQPAMKTTSKKRKSSEASAAMPPGRVMAPPPGQTKRILEPDERDRVTRQKATMAAATDHQEIPLGMDFESSMEMRDEFL
ncbi:hypothetical protein D1007_27390 [Hordeum vulgare]|nr:hypothetical protein D1007_27390 [Hordeum vulgare]